MRKFVCESLHAFMSENIINTEDVEELYDNIGYYDTSSNDTYVDDLSDNDDDIVNKK